MKRLSLFTFCCILIGLSFSCASKTVERIPESGAAKPHPQESTAGGPFSDLPFERKIIAEHAVGAVGLPYRWGGQSPETGFDCSGLVVYTHQMADIIIPRTARAQYENGRIVAIENLRVADLVFFQEPNESKDYHVGIYIGAGRFIHAPGKGRPVSCESMDGPYFLKQFIGFRTYL